MSKINSAIILIDAGAQNDCTLGKGKISLIWFDSDDNVWMVLNIRENDFTLVMDKFNLWEDCITWNKPRWYSGK